MDTSLLVGLGGHSLLVADGSSSVPLSSTLMGELHCVCSTSSGDETHQSKLAEPWWGWWCWKEKPVKKSNIVCVFWGEDPDLNSSLVSWSFLNEPADINLPNVERLRSAFTELCWYHGNRIPSSQNDRPVHQLQMLTALLPGWRHTKGVTYGRHKHIISLDGWKRNGAISSIEPNFEPPQLCFSPRLTSNYHSLRM